MSEQYPVFYTCKMIRKNKILTTGDKHHQLSHVFSSKKHFIFRSYDRDTLETYLTKRMVTKDEKLLQYFKNHIYANIFPYLIKQKGMDKASILLLEPQKGEVIVSAKEEMVSFDDEPTEIDGNALFISKTMIYGQSLRQMILDKDPRMDKQFCHDLVGILLDFILSHGVKDLIITSENVIVADSGFFHLNYFSFVGLQFWKMDKYITKAEFEEILPFLTVQIVKQEAPNRRIDLRMYLKLIMLNFFGAFFKKDLIFDSRHIDLDVQVKVTDEKVLKMIEKVQNGLLSKLLSQQEEQEIVNFDAKFKVNYLNILKVALNVNDLKGEDLNWEFILIYLSRNGETDKNQDDEDQGVFETYTIEKNEDRFSMNILEVFDIYITLMQLLQPRVEKEKKSKEKSKKLNLLEKAKELDEERTELLNQQRYSKSLYVPIIIGMKFSQILNFKNWVEMLNSAASAQKSTLDSLTKLIKFVIEVRQTLCVMEPMINNELLKKAISEKKCQEDGFHQSKSFYHYLELLTKESRPISQQCDSPIALKKNIKVQFWKISFWLLNQLLILIKKFFFRATEHNITSNIKAKRHDFSRIMMAIDGYTPEISVLDSEE